MNGLFIVVGLVLTPTAHADVSDSGNLTIGGQAVISGSMTVAGSAFSVGGTTFSVSGGSVTLGGRLNAAVAGIKWADGSTSTTAAPGGGGSSVLSASQTFSGYNQFTSSVSIGFQIYSSTIDARSVLVNGWTKVALSSFTTASATYFYGFYSSTTYRVTYELHFSGDPVDFRLSFNDDSIGWDYGNDCRDTLNGSPSNSGQNGAYVLLSGSDQVYGADFTGPTGWFVLTGVPFNAYRHGYGQVMYSGSVTANGTGCSNFFKTMYGGHTNTFRIKLAPSSGTMGGRIWVEQFTMKEAY